LKNESAASSLVLFLALPGLDLFFLEFSRQFLVLALFLSEII
jgi:hypothetical protein